MLGSINEGSSDNGDALNTTLPLPEIKFVANYTCLHLNGNDKTWISLIFFHQTDLIIVFQRNL